MIYYVTYKIDATYTAKVEADSLEDAMKKAEKRYYSADFGDAENIDGTVICVEDEDDIF